MQKLEAKRGQNRAISLKDTYHNRYLYLLMCPAHLAEEFTILLDMNDFDINSQKVSVWTTKKPPFTHVEAHIFLFLLHK